MFHFRQYNRLIFLPAPFTADAGVAARLVGIKKQKRRAFARRFVSMDARVPPALKLWRAYKPGHDDQE
jgi:hypothetical protein